MLVYQRIIVNFLRHFGSQCPRLAMIEPKSPSIYAIFMLPQCKRVVMIISSIMCISSCSTYPRVFPTCFPISLAFFLYVPVFFENSIGFPNFPQLFHSFPQLFHSFSAAFPQVLPRLYFPPSPLRGGEPAQATAFTGTGAALTCQAAGRYNGHHLVMMGD